MSVRKRPDTGRWQARYVGLDGRVHARDFDLRADAQRWERHQRRSVEQRDWAPQPDSHLRVGDLFEPWMATRQDVKQSTRQGYVSVYTRLVAPRWESVHLARVASHDVQDWVLTLSRADGSPMGASQKRQAHQVLAMILDHAVRTGAIPRNPARFDAIGKVTYLPKLRMSGTHRYLTASDLVRVAAGCGDYEPLIVLLGTTGLRWGEATALTVGDIDWLRRRIQVTKAHVEISGQVRIDTPKTHGCRTVPLTSTLLESLSRQVVGKEPRGLLFPAPHGGPLRHANFHSRVWTPARRAFGDPGLRIHDLRHTAASLAVAAGANVKAVQQMLGHASAQMTLDRYAGLFDGHLDEVADRLEALLNNSASDWKVTERSPAPGPPWSPFRKTQNRQGKSGVALFSSA